MLVTFNWTVGTFWPFPRGRCILHSYISWGYICRRQLGSLETIWSCWVFIFLKWTRVLFNLGLLFPATEASHSQDLPKTPWINFSRLAYGDRYYVLPWMTSWHFLPVIFPSGYIPWPQPQAIAESHIPVHTWSNTLRGAPFANSFLSGLWAELYSLALCCQLFSDWSSGTLVFCKSWYRLHPGFPHSGQMRVISDLALFVRSPRYGKLCCGPCLHSWELLFHVLYFAVFFSGQVTLVPRALSQHEVDVCVIAR